MVDGWVDFGGDAGVSRGSSSKSKALAVVGDSGRSSTFYAIVNQAVSQIVIDAGVTGFSVSDMSTSGYCNAVLYLFSSTFKVYHIRHKTNIFGFAQGKLSCGDVGYRNITELRHSRLTRQSL